MSDRRWSSNLMFLAAAIGSVVGIANVWKFTYVAGENGGGAFVIVYVLAVALVALPALIAEFLVGRRGGASVVKTMDNLAHSEGVGRWWRYYGQMAALGAFLALSFYSVIAGWTIDYFVVSLTRGFSGMSVEHTEAALDGLTQSPGRMMLSLAAFIVLTATVVAIGVRRGLENALRWLTPALFLILLFLVGYAVAVADFAAAARFLFVPDFSQIDANTILLAVGQAFFSLGIGLGVLLTIGAYMAPESSILRAGVVVAAADAAVALLAGLAVFPIVFGHGLSPAEGPGLIFATLPVAFGAMPAGGVLGPLFFLLLAIAALTSAITILETVVAAIEDYSGWPRARIVASTSLLLWLAGLGTVLSFNLLADFHPLGVVPAFAERNIFESLDYIVSNFMMPAGGVLIAVLAGWGLSRKATMNELRLPQGALYSAWHLLVRYIVPAAIALVFLANL
ncbi:MAG: sodium-dependent transporter [Gammaproteobacteria bacterium]|nr:sodium-dependent transporter [Gammaproteobacteria bacterium]